jgi:hypothetical protein
MHRTITAFLSAVSLTAMGASAQTLTVIPAGFENVEGSTSSSSLFQINPASMQVMYTEAFLAAAGITPGAQITGIAYRRQGGGVTGPPGDTFYDDYRIYMSQGPEQPALMTTTYASNVVGPQTAVYNGPITFPANSFPGGATPNAFGPIINFTTPYAYAGGSILFEFRRSQRLGDTTTNNTDVDGSVASQAGARWLFNTSSNAAVTGTLSNGGHIFQVQYGTGPTCYPNCDGSTQEPILNVADFSCFLAKCAAADPYANCDGSSLPPIFNVADFSCFLQKFAAGCR